MSVFVEETPIEGCFLVRFSKHEDKRGYFQRKYCDSCFKSKGLNTNWAQCNVSLNHHKATFRGFHYQESPFEEIKLVTCVKGSIQDAIIDIRVNSSTYRDTFSVELNESDNTSIYIAKGVAHGYLTLEDSSVILYNVSSQYSSESTKGVSLYDPKIDIAWKIKPEVISEVDLKWPSL